MNNLKKIASSLIFLSSCAFALPPMHIDYYGVVSSSQDTSMLKMAQDIFFTQLKSIENTTIDDKRIDASTALKDYPTTFTSDHLSFFAELKEKDNGTLSPQWECTYNIVYSPNNNKIAKTVIYESYYNILVNSKSTIEDILQEVSSTSIASAKTSTDENEFKTAVNLDSLAGNWSGEPYADKIVILRGGRGFVIFKNGASMNIAVTISDQDSKGNITGLKIKQTSKPNASFYPALPREIALSKAQDAEPISWELKLVSPQLMKGTKSTLIYSNENKTATKGSENITWHKK